jgi:HEAT repeats
LEAEDNDRSNRDWACLLLSQQDVDTDEVRNALMAAASDGDQYVRAEAILGLAQRSTELATPFVQAA